MIATNLLVVKLGGTTLAEEQHVLEDLARVARNRPVVVVHGGGKRLTDWLERMGVESRFEDGLRVTDDNALEVAAAVLGGLVNTELVAALRALGGNAVGVSGVEILVGERVVGLGRVARITGLQERSLMALLGAGVLPVVAPLVCDERGLICNVNADDVAAGIAAWSNADDLVLLTDVDGVLDAAGERVHELTSDEADVLIERGVISRGMVPKVRACAAAAANGHTRAIVVNGAAERPVERALSDAGFGTRLRAAGARAAGGTAGTASAGVASETAAR